MERRESSTFTPASETPVSTEVAEELSIDDIEIRVPVLDGESASKYSYKELNRQWLLLTEAARREILSVPEVREIAKRFIDLPVDESLSGAFLEALSSNERIARLLERYKEQIGDFLELAPVPDEEVVPDISNAPQLHNLESTIKYLLQGHDNQYTPEFYEELKRIVDSGVFLHGITASERLIITQRYRFAREVKLLALQAEVLSDGQDIEMMNENEFVLPSGTTITLNIENETKRQELLNPQNWKKRRQIKDRVYELLVGSSKYILKEKKTARHKDTMRHGHKPGITSLQEFQVAEYFQENAVIEQGDIKLNWESPVATVTFLDGFQFTVFEYTEGLIEDGSAIQQLSQEILENREMYEDEFNVIREMAKTFVEHPRVLKYSYRNTESSLKSLLKWLGLRKETSIQELTFNDFALIKSIRMQNKLEALRDETIIKNGFENRDHDGFAFKINILEGRPQLEIFGFDFEYFSPLHDGIIEDSLERIRKSNRNRDNYQGLTFYRRYLGDITIIKNAAYYAMLAIEGLLDTQEEFSI
ncbi:hypothetical protein KKG22_04755 [Patescibacteria group bacterium]|nr:hypothetical protein [Patescibacteria group bacterium]MBU1721645.1 hypothetical protein [Patescibacteria group bacterium]MBU1901644.1 hypothetical protein [Patescibacteria group bacterium]